MSKKSPPTNGFKKGREKTGGRKPGQQNHLSEDLKQALLNAAMRVTTAS